MSGITDARTAEITSTGEPGSTFDIVLRGYDRIQVDARLARATTDQRAAVQRITALEHRVEQLQAELGEARIRGAQPELSYGGLGARVEKILRLVEEEADDLRAEAFGQAEKADKAAQTVAAQVRAQAEEDGRVRREQSRQEASRLLAGARNEAARARAEAAAIRDEAAGVLEAARARAAWGRRRLRGQPRPAPGSRRTRPSRPAGVCRARPH